MEQRQRKSRSFTILSEYNFPDYTFTERVKWKTSPQILFHYDYSLSLLRASFKQIIIHFLSSKRESDAEYEKKHPSSESTTQFSWQNKGALNGKWKRRKHFSFEQHWYCSFHWSRGTHVLKVKNPPKKQTVKTDARLFWGPTQSESHNQRPREESAVSDCKWTLDWAFVVLQSLVTFDYNEADVLQMRSWIDFGGHVKINVKMCYRL